MRLGLRRNGGHGRKRMLFQTLGCGGIGFVALVSSFVSRGARESLGGLLSPCVANFFDPSASRWSNLRRFASQFPPRAYSVARHAMRSHKRGVLLCSASASTGITESASSNSYDELFSKPIKDEEKRVKGTALIVLNTAIEKNLVEILQNVWDRVGVVVCADGAGNRLDDVARSIGPEFRSKYVPHLLCGDLDSLKPEVAEHYREMGTTILRVTNQGTNDMEKCLQTVKDAYDVDKVILLGGLGGRFDHELGNINAMFKFLDKFSSLYMIGEDSLVQLLPPGKHDIRINKKYQGPFCGLLPIGGPTVVETKGLKWDLCGEKMEFGDLVSSSNIVLDEEVSIKTTSNVLWTISMKPMSST